MHTIDAVAAHPLGPIRVGPVSHLRFQPCFPGAEFILTPLPDPRYNAGAANGLAISNASRTPRRPVLTAANDERERGVNLHTYVINLPTAKERWRITQQRLQAVHLPYTRIEAVNGRALALPIAEFDEVGHRRCAGRRPILPEIGCYLSHLVALQAFLASNHELGLILEDDAKFDDGLPQAIRDAVCYREWWDILRLSSVNRDRYLRLLPLTGGRHLGISLTRSKGTAAYVVNRKAAQVLVRRLVPMRLAYDLAVDLEFFHGLRAFAVTPFPVRQDRQFETQIQSEILSHKLPATRYFTVFPFRAYVETARFLRRIGLVLTTRARLSSLGQRVLTRVPIPEKGEVTMIRRHPRAVEARAVRHGRL